MDLKCLNTFIQVAELGSFTRAADKLGYSQPTISFQIKQLESELGVQLFDRIGHTVSLTDSGRAALSYAQQICHIAEEMALADVGESVPSGTIRIAMADSLCAPIILRKFASFRSVYPKISLKITTAGTSELFRLLDHNEADIVCTLDSHIYNTTYVISNEEKIGVHFVCSPDHPFAGRKNIDIKDLLSKPLLLTEKGMSYRRLLDEKLAENSMEVHPVLETGSADILCKLTEENTGISFLPDYVTEAAVKSGTLLRLPVNNFKIELWKQVLYHRDKWVSHQMQAVINFLSEISL